MTFSIKKKTLKKVVASLTMFATVVSMSGMMALSTVVAAEAIAEGALIKSDATNPDGTPTYESLDVYIVKLVGEKKFKRLILNPTVFESYGHLNWSDIQTVSQDVMDEYTTSSLVRVIDTEKVFALVPDDDIGSKSWVNVTAGDFLSLADSEDGDSIYTINATDAGNYTEVGDITTVAELTTFYSTGELPSLEPVPVLGVLAVALSSETPAAGYILVDNTGTTTYQLQAPVVKYNMTAGEDTVVEKITFKRGGYVADADISEIYLFADGELVDYGPSNTESKMFTFSTPFTIEAGETVEVEVMVDMAVTTAGDSISFGIASADDIVIDGAEVEGSFPINGNIMSIADVDLAIVTIESEAHTVTNLEIGTENERLAKIGIDVSTNDVVAEKLAFTIVGTLGTSDLVNFELTDDNDVVIASVESMTDGKMVIFDDLDLDLEADNYTFYIRGDIMGGADRTFKFTGDEVYDFSFVDQEQEVKVPATPTNTQGYQSIAAGDFTIELADDSPLGNVADEDKGVVLAKYDFTAGGEKTKVTEFIITNTADSGTLTLEDVKVLVDGSQKGSTVATIASAGTGTFSFGNSFIVNLGETAVVEIVADLDNANVDIGDQFHIVGGATVDYTLMESNTDMANQTLPNGYILAVSSATLAVSLSSDTPESQIMAMGTKKEVGRWIVEANDGDVEIEEVDFTNTETGGNLEDNVNVAYLTLYDDADTEIETASISLTTATTTGVVWFGNDTATAGFDATDNLSWDLESGEAYELVLEYGYRNWAPTASGADTGFEVTPSLHNIEYYKEAQASTADETASSAASKMMLRRSMPTVTVTSGDTTLSTGSNKILYSTNIVAGSEGKVGLKRFVYTVAITDAAATDLEVDTYKFYRGSTEITALSIYNEDGVDLTGALNNAQTTATTKVIVTITDEEEIAAGDDNTYHLKATVANANDDDQITVQMIEDTTKLAVVASVYLYGSTDVGAAGENDIYQYMDGASITASTDVVVWYDVNNNGTWEEAVDSILGEKGDATDEEGATGTAIPANQIIGLAADFGTDPTITGVAWDPDATAANGDPGAPGTDFILLGGADAAEAGNAELIQRAVDGVDFTLFVEPDTSANNTWATGDDLDVGDNVGGATDGTDVADATSVYATANMNFIWSDESAGTSHDIGTTDWTNGYMVDDMPTTETFMTK